MKKLMYLLVAGTLFIFTACNCGSGDATSTEEVAVEEVAVEEVVADTAAVEEVVADTAAVEEVEATEE